MAKDLNYFPSFYKVLKDFLAKQDFRQGQRKVAVHFRPFLELFFSEFDFLRESEDRCGSEEEEPVY